MITWMVIILVPLLVVSIPIGFAIGLSSSLVIYLFTDYTRHVIAGRMIMGIDSYVLLAIPLFVLAGRLMNEGGITDIIFNFARNLIGWIPGGIAHTNVIASIIFAGMSGSSVADAAGLGIVEIRAMEEHGYDKKYAAAVTAASSTIGTIVPPSIPMLLYASLAGVSIGRLFLGGIIPGFLMGLSMMVLIYLQALRMGVPYDDRASFFVIIKSFFKSLPAIFTPVIILGGIITGIFTVTEAAAAAAFYSFVIAFFYGGIKFSKLPKIMISTGITTATILFILANAQLMSWLLVRARAGQILTQAILSLTENPLIVLLLLNIMFLIIGCFLELGATMILFVPLLRPLLLALGIDLVHFGVVMTVNLMIGFITPPFGMALFVISEVADLKVEDTIRNVLPFLIPLIITLLLITYFPEAVMAIPNWLMPQ